MRKLIKRAAGWIHTTLILALIMPLLYAFIAEPSDLTGQVYFYKCLLIALPVAATDLAIKRCKSLFSYLAISALILAVTAVIGWLAAGALRQGIIFWFYMTLLLAETMIVTVIRMVDRLRKKWEEDNWDKMDPSYNPSVEHLSEPSFFTLIYFVAVYVLGINLNSPAVCNAALLSAIVYTLTTFLYKHVQETEKYLDLNRRTCNIPSKRIYGIGNCMLGIFLLLFMIVMLPALFTTRSRHYRDLRETALPTDAVYEELMEEYKKQHAEEDLTAMLGLMPGEPEPGFEWIEDLFYILSAAICLFLLAALIKFIFAAFRTFRQAADENGDVVEELRDTDEGIRIKKTHVRRRSLSERERIRREYRRFIRRHRKDRPAHYESPTEIEQKAGIEESQESKELHKQYELARYGQEI